MTQNEPPGTRIGAPELRLDHIVKDFGSTRALDGALLTVRPGTVHALLGENGAGKTTLMRVAFGLLDPDRGRILIDGRETRFPTAARAIGAGIGMVHQHFTNVAAMTVAENVALGNHGLYSPKKAAERVREVSAQTQLVVDPDARVESLNVGAQQRLEIVKALSRRARILILDEPTAVLAPSEARELLLWIRSFANEGSSVILITHKLTEALSVADDVTVLRFGRTVLTSRASETSADQLAAAMLGESLAVAPTPPQIAKGDLVLRLSDVSIAGTDGVTRVRDVELEVYQREILGVAALENSGHDLLLRAIASRAAPTHGSIQRIGQVALIPEDRHRDALILGFSLTENVSLKGAGRRQGRINWQREREATRKLAERYDVRTGSIDVEAGQLSGGNQQKLVLARELSDSPALIVAENPTRGLDVRATAAVHSRLRDAAAGGAAVVLYSSDLDEVLALATRVIAVHQGRVIAVPNDREAAGRAMLGLAAN